jgi:YHS domain-containing protein
VIRFLLLAILVLIAARLFWRLMDSVIAAAGGKPPGRSPARAVKLQRDPVCGTFVAPETALSLASGNTTFYFCSEDCRAKFQIR